MDLNGDSLMQDMRLQVVNCDYAGCMSPVELNLQAIAHKSQSLRQVDHKDTSKKPRKVGMSSTLQARPLTPALESLASYCIGNTTSRTTPLGRTVAKALRQGR